MVSRRRLPAVVLIRTGMVATLYALWCLFAPPAVLARDQDRLEQVLEEWAEALGGRERLSQVRTTHRLSTVNMFALEGTLEEWYTAEGEHRLDLDLSGAVKMTIVKTPNHCWLMDQNGKVSQQAGKDLKDEIRDVFLGTWSHLLPGRTAGRAELLTPDPGTGQLRVKVVPLDGTEATIWIDPQRHLPVRWESPAEAGETLSATLSEWRDFEGVLMPARIVQTTGTPENDVVIAVREIRFNESPPLDTFTEPEEQTEEVHFAEGREARNIPLDIDGVHLFLQGHMNGSDALWFLLDTGASMTIIDQEVAGDLGLELTGRVMGDGVGEKKVAVTFARIDSTRVQGAELSGQTVAVIPVRDMFEARVGREVDGILGYDFISRFVVGIDYWNEKLHLYDRSGWDYQGTGAELPIRIVETRAAIDATITLPGGSSVDGRFYIDTGSGVTLRLNRPFTEEHDLLSLLPKTFESAGGYGVGGVTLDTLGRIAGLAIGDLELEAPTCFFSRDDKGLGAGETFAGKIGGGILERFTVVLDYERQRVYLEPNPRFGTPFPGDMSGLTISTGGRGDWHTFTVAYVIEGSPGDKADIKPGDIIISLDGESALELRKKDLTEALGERDRTLRLGIRRHGEVLTKELLITPML